MVNLFRWPIKALLSIALAAISTISFAQSQNARGDGPQAPAEGEAIWQVVQQLPVTEQGQNGPVLYVLAYSSCPYTAGFERDWAEKLSNVRVRWMLYPINDLTANTTADAALAKDPIVLSGILNHTRVSPPVRSSPDLIAAYNSVTAKMNEVNAVFARFHHYHVISPTFVWRTKDQVFVVRGYDRNTFEKLMLPSLLQSQ